MFMNVLFTLLNDMNVNILKFKKMIKKILFIKKIKNLLFVKCEYNKLQFFFLKHDL